MPKLTRLPNGQWAYVPDIDPYIEQLRSRSFPMAGASWGLEEEDEKEGSLAGSAWEGIKSIPSGVADIFLSGAQAAIGVATPFADLPVEQRLRKQASKRARERDPAYQDAFLPAVGTGLGQLAGLSAISRLPYGWPAAMGAGVAMGISDQTRRIADYEQRTGTDVPWYKESMAHLMGAVIGLSEVVPIKLGLYPTSVSKMMGRMKAGVDPNSFRHMSKLEKRFGLKGAMVMGLEEAAQEASAQWLQAISARGLYDPDAMEDIAHAMAEDFKVGGAVGGIAKLVQHQILGRKFRGSNADNALTAEVKRSERRQDDLIRDVHGNIAGIREEFPKILRERGVDEGLAREITSAFGGTWSSIPRGMDDMLRSGMIRRSQVEEIVREFQLKNEGAMHQLDRMAEYHARAGNNAEVKRYTNASTALGEMVDERVGGLRKAMGELVGGLGEMGGLTGDSQYQEARREDIENDAHESFTGVQLDRQEAERHGGPMPSFRHLLRRLMGGVRRIRGFYDMAEDLGVHRGPGSERVGGAGAAPTISDLELASSDRANFDIVELGGILIGRRGPHKSSTAEKPVDESDVLGGLGFLDSLESEGGERGRKTREKLDYLALELEKIESQNDNLYKAPQYAFTREYSEVFGKREYADDAAWERHRDEIAATVARQVQKNNAEISRINREQSVIYAQVLAQRLEEVRRHFQNPDAAGDKKKAAIRVFGKADIPRFDRWLGATINAVNQSAENGRLASEKVQIDRQEFERKMAASDDTEATEAEKEAVRAQFLSENIGRYIEFPRDISATQLISIVDLFVDDPTGKGGAKVRGDLESALALRGLGDIAKWQVRDKLYEVTVDGVPVPLDTRKVVKEFEDKLTKLTTDKGGRVSQKNGRREYVSEDDIRKLLRSKNIYLRDGKRIGEGLAKLTGAGVKSRPFEKLLQDMTGAQSWEEATYGQRLLMYSRLLQLPGHHESRSDPEEQSYLEEVGAADYRPLFLPDFYHDPDLDSHIDHMTDLVVRTTEGGDQQFPSTAIKYLEESTRGALGDQFDIGLFNEALARLIETSVFNQVTAESAPAEVVSKERPVRVAMRFKDGAMGMRMREGLEGKSTMELIEEGVRTGTSRQSKNIKANVGDVVEFYDGKKTVRAVITKGWTKLDKIDPEYWSQIEGWDTAAYKKLANAGYWQFEYELMEDIAPPASPRTGGSGPRVTFNAQLPDLEDIASPSEGDPGVIEPGDPDPENAEQRAWARGSKIELIREHLADEDASWASLVDDMWASWNEKRPGKPLTKKQFIEQHAALITSTIAPLQELSDLGILETVGRTVVRPGRQAPTESILQLDTVGGRSLVRSLVRAGALPSSLQDNVHSLRRRFVETMRTRFELLDRNFEKVVKTSRLPDRIRREYVDSSDGLFQSLSEVAIRGDEMSADLPAIYDRPGNRIIINLAAIDPDNMGSAQEVIADAAFHEGLHALLIRDHLTEEELAVLRSFVRNKENVVPKEIDRAAYDAGLTWFERSVIDTVSDSTETDLSEGDIEKESIISLLENLVRHPDIYEQKKKTRKIGKDVRSFLEGFVGAAKDADIVDVMRILGRIESGEVGERGHGFLGDAEYTPDSIIRSNDLLRYANPKDIEQLRAAIILRDAAPSDQMRKSEQAKVDDIADKIISNRGIIQGSAPPSPDEVQAMKDARQKIQHMRDTHAGSIPVIGLDHSKKDPEAYKLALNTFMEMRGKDRDYAYKMPAPYQTFFDNRPRTPIETRELVRKAIEDGDIAPTDRNSTRKSIESGALSGGNDTGNTVEETADNVGRSASNLRYLYLDRRHYIVKQTDRLIAAQNRAQLDAETSALVMWRNSDNALNWLPGLMLRGPLSYLGTSVGSGRFENAPVYDDYLAETYGGDGRIWGINEIFAPIIDSQDQEAALLYGMAKRISWTKERRDSLRSVISGIAADDLDPATKLKWIKFEAAYKAANPKNKSEEWLREIIESVETNESGKIIIEFWDRYNAYDNQMIKMSYETGMITREVYDEWMSMPYAPFYREVMKEGDFPIGSGEVMATRGTNLVEKALRGSAAPISTDLAEGIITNTQALVRDVMMNVSVARVVRDAVSLGEARKVNISSMAASLDSRIVRVMEEGIPVFYELDDAQLAMSTMMMGFNPKKQLQEFFGGESLPRFSKLTQQALTKSSTLLRESVTRTLPFATKNIFRDSWTAMQLTGGGPSLILNSFRNALDVDVLRRADEAGLSIGIDFVAEPTEYGRKMRKELEKANLNWKNPLSPFVAAWHLSGRIAKQSEVATRLAVYDRVLAMTGDKSLAQYYAVEIMNYGRRGASATLSTWMATVPFMNGRLQGADVMYRALRERKGSSDIPGLHGYGLTADEYENLPMWKKSRSMILGRGLALMGATSALYFLMRDDEEWQDLRDEVKADNWVLPLSDGAWLKIPIPFELGVLFKVIPEKLLEATFEKDVDMSDVSSEVIRQLKTTLSMGGPQLFTPIVNAMRNYDTFRKDAIVDPWMEETLSPNEQRNRYTSNVARGIADLADSVPLVRSIDFLTSPMKVEYMMRQYLGTMGSYGITLADRIARTGILPDLPFDPYMNLAEAESVIGTNKDFDFESLIGGEGIANVPILGDLLTDPRGRGGRQQDFFNIIKELDTIVATLNSITERDAEKGYRYATKHFNILRHSNQLRFIQGQLKEWRERREDLAGLRRGSMSEDYEREYYHRLLDNRQNILTNVEDLMASIKSG